ncbi:MAG: hypothetical protein E6K90_02210 [Thaumarchaeota archaeon]|nr:MAG: hypothetical protein E6K90_02210 [Nitrososphaerota archaeon]
MRRYTARATTMQALVKYHGLRDWKLRLPYHDSISVNTTSMTTKATLTDPWSSHGVYIEGRYSESATRRLQPVIEKLTEGSVTEEWWAENPTWRNSPGSRDCSLPQRRGRWSAGSRASTRGRVTTPPMPRGSRTRRRWT